MRLNSAPASSFLFVAIVLADDHPEKHQRRFVNSVDKDLDVTLPLDWAGASWLGGGEGDLNSVSGSFSVPLAWGGNGGTGVSVAIAIGGIVGACADTATNFWTGIDVSLTGDNVSYTGWATWGTRTLRSTGFYITTGDFIQASLTLKSRKSGVALLENLSRNQTWRGEFATDNDMVCQGSGEWVVTPLANFPGSVVLVPMFSTVVFANATAGTIGGATVQSGGGRTNNLVYETTELTDAMAGENIVVVVREMY